MALLSAYKSLDPSVLFTFVFSAVPFRTTDILLLLITKHQHVEVTNCLIFMPSFTKIGRFIILVCLVESRYKLRRYGFCCEISVHLFVLHVVSCHPPTYWSLIFRCLQYRGILSVEIDVVSLKCLEKTVLAFSRTLFEIRSQKILWVGGY